ncbi:MAG TPA: recombinase family protein [Steroidobacteraceae bacterium]
MRSQIPKPKILRCAIYTRKSSEEGLEQDFNSLHAQRESCEAYIKSQKHEGWAALPAVYDDGGYSGGSMDRPALKRLLADIKSKSVDVVVVYKVDRLTRSLADFAKIVEVFDAAGVSFVSVTQQFNTTTSMGRLTLNVLLSFAQFEREVTGERIRDKIAASKQKGMWMGGWVPLGYDRRDRTLTINETEAKTVRTIFDLFLKLKNVQRVQEELVRLNLMTKRYVLPSARTIGSLPFARGHIYRILANPLYIGEIEHKGVRHPGQHPRLIDQATWDAVHAQIGANRHNNRTRTNAKSANLLAGLIYDEAGNRLISTHAAKNGKRYRYYITSSGPSRNAVREDQAVLRLPAADLDAAVIQSLQSFLNDRHKLTALLRTAQLKPAHMREALEKAEKTAQELQMPSPAAHLALITKLIDRVDLREGLRVVLDPIQLLGHLTDCKKREPSKAEGPILLDVPFLTRAQNGTSTLVVLQSQRKKPDNSVIAAIARGFCWFEELTSNKASAIQTISIRENVTASYVSRLLNLAHLSPGMIENFMNGRQSTTRFEMPSLTRRSIDPIWRKQTSGAIATSDA